MNITVNSVNLYYEVSGKGRPIILLHGNRETHKVFDKLIERLSENYKVYAIDSRCHGKSENSKVISYELMRDDVISFIKELKLENPIVYGFSDGGIVGLLIAIKEPELLSKLIVSGPNLYPGGMKDSMLRYSKIGYFLTKNKLFKLMLEEPNISFEELRKIKTSTVIFVGERDIVKLEHTKLIADNIKGSVLEIIKGEGHGSYIVHREKIYNLMKKYLET